MQLMQKFGSGMQILRANLQHRYRTPLSVYLSLTDRCPNRCIYCNYYNLKDDRQELKTSQILHLIDEMVPLMTRRLHFTGGEPLIRNDIGEVIDYAKARGLFVGVSASGLLIPKKVGELKNVDIVFLSLDGDERTNDLLRGSGAYQMAMEAMDALKSNKIKFFTTTVITRENRHSIDHILKMAREEGFWSNYVFLYHEDEAINHFPSSKKLEKLMLTDKEVKETAAYLLNKKRGGEPVGSSAEYLKFLLNWEEFPKTYSPRKASDITCWAGRLSCHINAEGQLYGCGVAMGMVEGQDVVKLGLREAFDRSCRVPDCNSCIYSCWLESNIMFSLNVGAIWNWLRVLGNSPK